MTQRKSLPQDWKWVTLGDVTQSIDKAQPKENPNKPFKYLDISSIDNNINKITRPKQYLGKEAPSRARQIIKKNDVLFSTVRTYLRNIAFVPDIYDGEIASTGFSVLRSNDSVKPKFLFYYCLTIDFLEPLNNLQRGTSYPAVRDGDVRSQPFPLAPVEEQEQIINKIEELFSQLDAGVAGLKRAQAELKRYRASVLKAAFEGRLVPQDPNDEPADNLLKSISKEKLNYGQQIPEEWVWSKVGDLSDLIQYGYTQSSTKEQIGPKFLRITDIQNGDVNWEEVPYCEIDKDDFHKYELFSGDIVFARTGATTGKSFLIGKCPKSVFASYLIRIRLKDIIYPKFCYLFFQSPMYWSKIMTTKKGSTQPGVNANILSKIEIPLPALNEQMRIVDEINKSLSFIENLEKSINKQINLSDNLRISILNSVFDGSLI